MGKLLEIKKALELNKTVEIEETEIIVSFLNFSTGLCDRYKFDVTSVMKVPYGSSAYDDDYANHVVLAYGVITYESGNSYNQCEKLTYTDEEELDKILSAVQKKLGNLGGI
jgi:hypothetical protein